MRTSSHLPNDVMYSASDITGICWLEMNGEYSWRVRKYVLEFCLRGKKGERDRASMRACISRFRLCALRRSFATS